VDSVAKDFFVSYTAADKAWATWIAYILEADGFAVTIQEWDFRPGSNFAAEMDKALKQCPRMIAVLSPAYLKARFPTAEWTAVFAGDPEGAINALVPIMVEECRPEGLLSQVVQIRIHGLDEAVAHKQILEGVRHTATVSRHVNRPRCRAGIRRPVSGGGESARRAHVGGAALARPGAAGRRIVAP
jgi:hypothetical protein